MYMYSDCLELVFQSVTGKKLYTCSYPERSSMINERENQQEKSLHIMLAWNWTLG